MKKRALPVHLSTALGLALIMLAVTVIWRDQAYLLWIWPDVAMLIDGLNRPSAWCVNAATICPLGAIQFLPVRFEQLLFVVFLHRINAQFVYVWAAMQLIYPGVRITGTRSARTPPTDILCLTFSWYFLPLSSWRGWSLRTC